MITLATSPAFPWHRMSAALDRSEIRTGLTRTIFSIVFVFLIVGSVGVAFALGIASNVVRSVNVIVRHARNKELALTIRDAIGD